MSRSHSILVTVLVIIVAIAGGMLLSRGLMGNGDAQAPLTKATKLDPVRPMPAFEFTDHLGAPFNSARLKDQWTVMFFGFTNCPDVCPATLAVLAQAEKTLSDLPAASKPRVVLVSVDPQRDTPEKLASYVKFFSPSFLGVTGTQETIAKFTREMGIPVAIHRLEDGNYTVDHSAIILLIDPNAALTAVFSTPHEPQVIAADYRRIVEHSE
jgi:protein SCO1/2